ncbi:MAG: DUF3106 domain-containing protein [Gallionella sp.]
MDKLPDVPAPPLAAITRERPANTPARIRSTGRPSGIGRLPVLVVALAAWFSLNALAADTPAMTGARSAVSPSADAVQREEMRAHWDKMSPEERNQIRARIQEHWKSMSPEQREERRKEMREHFKNMSPQERQQFKSDMDLFDGMPPPENDQPGNDQPGNDQPGSKADSAASSTKG